MHSPLLGFNNNVKHKGKVFHLQTEDSGIKHPHVITHLFADGGRILKTVKTSYAEHVGSERLSDVVRDLMKEQHKAMFIALRDGQFDALISGTSTAAKSAAENHAAKLASVPASARPSAAMSAPPPLSAPRILVRNEEVTTATAVTEPPPPSAVRDVEARPQGRQQAPELFTAQPSGEAGAADTSALERAAGDAASARPSYHPGGDLPPPPATVLGKKPDGGYRNVSPSERPRAPRENPAPGSGRYAASRPATIFANSRPESGSIFGEELISEKSLDEVILSYLAEDLEGAGPPKK